MAEARRELKEEKKAARRTNNGTMVFSSTPESEARKPGADAKAGNTAKTKASGGGGGNRAPSGSGADRLNRAADRLVRRDSKELSELLLEKAKAGNMTSFRLLVMLAERKKPREKPVKKARWPSLAMALAAEPEWEGKEGGT